MMIDESDLPNPLTRKTNNEPEGHQKKTTPRAPRILHITATPSRKNVTTDNLQHDTHDPRRPVNHMRATSHF
jgi:hypothetical protein